MLLHFGKITDINKNADYFLVCTVLKKKKKKTILITNKIKTLLSKSSGNRNSSLYTSLII